MQSTTLEWTRLTIQAMPGAVLDKSAKVLLCGTLFLPLKKLMECFAKLEMGETITYFVPGSPDYTFFIVRLAEKGIRMTVEPSPHPRRLSP